MLHLVIKRVWQLCSQKVKTLPDLVSAAIISPYRHSPLPVLLLLLHFSLYWKSYTLYLHRAFTLSASAPLLCKFRRSLT